jgi:hypothetical protein
MSYEKIAAAANLITSGLLKNTFKSPQTWKSIGTHAAVGGGVGAVGNVVAGNPDESIARRAVKGGLLGAGVGAGVGAGRNIAKNVGEQAKLNAGKGFKSKLKEFKYNKDVHGVAGQRTPEQLARVRSDQAIAGGYDNRFLKKKA